MIKRKIDLCYVIMSQLEWEHFKNHTKTTNEKNTMKYHRIEYEQQSLKTMSILKKNTLGIP